MWNISTLLFFDIHFLVWMYLAIMNLLTFIFYGVDKRRAQKGEWRIPEKTLLLLAVLGGSVGALVGMRVFRHKTQKALFRFGVPLILVLQVVGFFVL